MLSIYDRRREERIEEYPRGIGRDYVTAETDGSTVPVVVTDKNAEDQRKGKKTFGKRHVRALRMPPEKRRLNSVWNFRKALTRREKIFSTAPLGRGSVLIRICIPWVTEHRGSADKQENSSARGGITLSIFIMFVNIRRLPHRHAPVKMRKIHG